MSEELFDLEEFKDRVQGDTELLLELLEIFVADYEVKRQSLQEAVGKGDYEEIKSVAHSLKGASGNISAKSLREVFVQIEELAKTNDMSKADGWLNQLDEVYAALGKRIEEVKVELS